MATEVASSPAPTAFPDHATFHVHSPHVSEALQALGDGDWQVRVAAAAALEEIGPRAAGAVPTLVQALKDDDVAEVRRAAAEALGGIGPRAVGAVASLARAMEGDESAYVRWVAARALRAIIE